MFVFKQAKMPNFDTVIIYNPIVENLKEKYYDKINKRRG